MKLKRCTWCVEGGFLPILKAKPNEDAGHWTLEAGLVPSSPVSPCAFTETWLKEKSHQEANEPSVKSSPKHLIT